jgi:hypothetical protein
MEIHAHELHKAPGHGWKHYFFEFFMLFFAITLSFFVENLREEKVEHKNEKEYISSLIRDFSKDTSELNDCIEFNTFNLNIYDTLCTLLKRPDPLKNIDSLYYYFVPTTQYYIFQAVEVTIKQLENAGGLRFIRSKQTADSIITYYNLVSQLEVQSSIFFRYFDQYHQASFSVFDYSQIYSLYYNRRGILTDHRKFTLLTNDKFDIKVFFNKLYVLTFIQKFYIEQLQSLKSMSVSRIKYLKKEYRLE